jgi:hypothetical protein
MQTYVSLLEALSLVSASSVGNEGGVLSLDGKEILEQHNKHLLLSRPPFIH